MKIILYLVLIVVAVFTVRAWLRSRNAMAGQPVGGVPMIMTEAKRKFEDKAIQKTAKDFVLRRARKR